MADSPEHRIVYRNPQPSPLGQVTLAGFLQSNSAFDLTKMRILGRYALVYVLADGGRFVQRGLAARPVSAGDLIWVFPQIPHRYGPSPGESWNEFYIVFTGPLFDLWLAEDLISSQKPIWHLEPTSYWLRRLTSCVEGGEGQLEALERVCRLQQVVIDALKQQHNQRRPDAPQWFDHACHLLARPAGPDIEQVAEQLGISYESFRKQFAQLSGSPPAKYRTMRTIELACRMLSESQAALKSIATECGFCDEFHFSRRFRQIMGLAPSDYRARAKRS